MTFLPIVERELRLGARKWASFWIRMVAALITCLIGGGFLMFTLLGLVQPNSVGSNLFSLLTWMAFIVACVAGVFFTSDSISEEKREGTLGLLFLTDLRGHDVVLGKLVSNSLRSAYGLLATFPIVALALIMGGVTGGAFWRTALALLLTLGFSLTTGICLSSVTTDGRKSLGGTLLVVLLACAGAPVADQIWAVIDGRNFQPLLSWLSPGFLFVTAASGRGEYWTAAAVCAGLSLAALTIACWFTPRGWQETRREAGGEKGLLYSLKYGSAKTRDRRRRKLLPLSPVLWFCSRLRWRGGAVSVALALAILLQVVLLLDRDWRDAAMGIGVGGTTLMAWILCFWMASESARFFVESRRNGALELLLSTPLTGDEVVAGLRGALWRLFLVPVLLLVALHLTSAVTTLLALKSMNAAAPGAGAAFLFMPFVGLGTGILNMFSRVADLLALGWVGVWMGLTSRNANLAVLKTLLFVQVLPWLASAFISATMMMAIVPIALRVGGTSGMEWLAILPAVVNGLLWIGKDVIFIVWARSRLKTDLRILAVPESARVWGPPAPPPLPAAQVEASPA